MKEESLIIFDRLIHAEDVEIMFMIIRCTKSSDDENTRRHHLSTPNRGEGLAKYANLQQLNKPFSEIFLHNM